MKRRFLQTPVCGGTGISSGQINLNVAALAGIYQCNITHWDDPALTALNPGVALPHTNITPIAYAEDVAVTQVFLQYLQLDGTWTLGVGTNFNAPPCVQHASLWSGVLAKMAATPNSVGCEPNLQADAAAVARSPPANPTAERPRVRTRPPCAPLCLWTGVFAEVPVLQFFWLVSRGGAGGPSSRTHVALVVGFLEGRHCSLRSGCAGTRVRLLSWARKLNPAQEMSRLLWLSASRALYCERCLCCASPPSSGAST